MSQPPMVDREKHERDVPRIFCPGCGWERPIMSYDQYLKLYSLVTPEEVLAGRFNQTSEEYMQSIHAGNDAAIETHIKICADYRRLKGEREAFAAKAKEILDTARPGSTTAVLMVPDGQGGVQVLDQQTIKEGRLDS